MGTPSQVGAIDAIVFIHIRMIIALGSRHKLPPANLSPHSNQMRIE